MRNNKKIKIISSSIALALIGTGVGVGIGYGIWYSKTTPTPTVPTLTLQLRTGSTILQNEGDTLIYDLKPNMDLKNFTGTSISLPNVESINESGIDGHPGPGYITWWDTDKDMHSSITDPTKEESISGLFWNDKNDITKGAFVRLHLNKDYNGTQTFLPFVYKVTIHDNNDKHPDAQAEQSFILATDAEQSEIGNDVIKNVSTKKMGMTSATTPTQIVQYLKANNNTLTGDQVLSDDFIKNNLNANQLAALLFLETLEIQKNWLVNLNDKYSFIPGRSEILPDWSQYQIDVRINDIVHTGADGEGSQLFDVSFEQDIINSSDVFFPSFRDSYYGKFNNADDNEYYAVIGDLPSAWYTGINIKLNSFVSSWSGSETNESGWPTFNGQSISRSLYTDSDTISGNLNAFWCNPIERAKWSSDIFCPVTQINFSPLEIARLFWPNVNWLN